MTSFVLFSTTCSMACAISHLLPSLQWWCGLFFDFKILNNTYICLYFMIGPPQISKWRRVANWTHFFFLSTTMDSPTGAWMLYMGMAVKSLSFWLCVELQSIWFFPFATAWPRLFAVFFLCCFHKLSLLVTNTFDFPWILESPWSLPYPCRLALPKENEATKGVGIGDSPHRTFFYHYSHQHELLVAHYPQEWMEQ